MRYIQRFDSASTEQAAIDAGQLGKPYIAFIEDGQYIDWNTKDKRGMLRVKYYVDWYGGVILYNNGDNFSAGYYEDGTEFILPENNQNLGGLTPGSEIWLSFELKDKTLAGGEDTFWNKKNIREVVIPEGVITIPTKYLNFTDRITSLSIPSTVTTIGGAAFNRISYSDDYDTIKEVHIPAGVTNIGDSCFADNTKLDCVVFEGTVPPTIGSFNVFNGSFTIYVPDASVTAYKTARKWSNYADRIKGISEKPE